MNGKSVHFFVCVLSLCSCWVSSAVVETLGCRLHLKAHGIRPLDVVYCNFDDSVMSESGVYCPYTPLTASLKVKCLVDTRK